MKDKGLAGIDQEDGRNQGLDFMAAYQAIVVMVGRELPAEEGLLTSG